MSDQIGMLAALAQGAQDQAAEAGADHEIRNAWLDLRRASDQLRRKLVRREQAEQEQAVAQRVTARTRARRRPAPYGTPLVAG